MLAETGEIAEEEKVFEKMIDLVKKKLININNKKINMNKYHISSDFISLADFVLFFMSRSTRRFNWQ